MWFASDPAFWPGQGIQLLAVSCVALVAALHVWVIHGSAFWILRWGTLSGVALLLIHLRSVELVLFIEGHLIAVLVLYCVSNSIRIRGGDFRNPDFLAPVAVLSLESAFALLRIDALYPGRWFGLGLGAGAAATIVDAGMRCRRGWLLCAVGSGCVALGVTYVTAAWLVNRDLFGFYLKFYEPAPELWEREWFSDGSHLLGLGTLFYWVSRFAAHLAVVTSPVPEMAAVPQSDTPFRPDSQFAWWRLGTGVGRAARLVIAWPALLGLSVFIFTPWLEAYFNLPPLPVIPPQPQGPNAFAQLIEFPNGLNWSMTNGSESEEWTPESFEPFCRANHRQVSTLEEIIAKRCVPPIDYSPLASPMTAEQVKSIDTTRSVLRSLLAQAVLDVDIQRQCDLARVAVLFGRPFRRGGLFLHHVHGRFSEELGLRAAIEALPLLNGKQCQDLITLLSNCESWEESDRDVAARDANWLLAIRGWRQRLELACYAARYFGYKPLFDFEREHRALRATLICELALRHYIDDHQRPAKSLDDLVPKYLARLPVDPFGGGKLQYHASGQLPIPYFAYSVGYNKQADDGFPWESALPMNGRKPDDISIVHWIREKWREETQGAPPGVTISVEATQDPRDPQPAATDSNQDRNEQNLER
jgi:hypothetical protein